jgi:hypothetical protein
MTSTRRILRLFSRLLALAAVATLAKHVTNSLTDYENGFVVPRSTSVADARAKGILVAALKADPVQVNGAAKTFEFEEAWIESSITRSYWLVWFPYDMPSGWNTLCIRPRTQWYQNTFSYSVCPEYPGDWSIPGQGDSDGHGWTLLQDNRYVQRVPCDLRELKLHVRVEFYGRDAPPELGTVQLAAED